MRFLVTAGNTREKIDRVRDWGNIFTGGTGYSIAREIARFGQVDLLTSNQQHLNECKTQTTKFPIAGTHFTSHEELRGQLAALVTRQVYDAIFMTAAVADYTPAGAYSVLKREILSDGQEQWLVQNVQAGKVKSFYNEIAILGKQTEKLIDLFRKQWNYRGLLIKFKLEVGIDNESLLAIARKSREASDANYIVANTLEMVQGENPGAYLVGPDSHEWVPRAGLSARLAELVSQELKIE